MYAKKVRNNHYTVFDEQDEEIGNFNKGLFGLLIVNVTDGRFSFCTFNSCSIGSLGDIRT